MAMRIYAGAASRTGRRTHNEDSLLMLPERGVFAVSDGMGGLEAGEEASAAAVGWVERASEGLDALRRRVEERADPGSKLALLEGLEAIFRKSTEVIYKTAQSRNCQMGATLTVAVIAGDALFVCHVGDSRLYLLRGGRAAPLTTDHSVGALQLRRGQITQEEYNRSDMRHVLYQALGVLPEVRPDVIEFGIEDGDAAVICSDGVWDHVPRSEMARIVDDYDPKTAAGLLLDLAYERGSTDNLTAVVVRCETPMGTMGDSVDWDSVLQRIPLFASLDSAARMQLAPYLAVVRCPPGEYLIREGEPGEELYAIIDGELSVSRGGVELRRMGPGEHFGEIALALDAPRSASVRAVVPTRLLVLNRAQVDAIIDRTPAIGARVMARLVQTLAERVVELSERVVELKRR